MEGADTGAREAIEVDGEDGVEDVVVRGQIVHAPDLVELEG